ncbi:potassium-transporting ATPase subunit KdpC [Pseudomonas sp. RIT-PI-AD]|uniref:potassium-transporting ATPase subunit KdpC n=1 Tax=Pseudomonas sp. RIT-PI-AD TaxID=3035294 RepID=UPI0021D8076B|nr:potassium-transporting ATPase subunit KdpC [Pseudomonas sp. RIT-PI-AD]
MFEHFRPAFCLLALLGLITGVAYPLSVTAIAQLAFPEQANGSLVRDASGRVRGSLLLAQPFEGAEWFQPRPSATGFVTLGSGASNLAPSNPALAQRIATDAQRLGGTRAAPVPLELLTTSGSGLDPHLSPAAARYQVPRIAAARGLPPASLERLIERTLERPLVGPEVVNVLALNRALADNRLSARPE